MKQITKWPCTSGIRGLRKLAFEESSERSKRRKPKELRQTAGFPELTHATKMRLRSAGKTDVAKLFSEALETTPTRALRIRKAWTAHAKNIVVPYTPEEALSLFIEAYLTKKNTNNSKPSTNEELQHLPQFPRN
jgi:hypothetical protein